MTEPLANLDGQILPLSQVKIPATDRGFLFGDAIYEVLRVYQGKPWLEEEHFQRLHSSLKAIRISGVDVDRLRERMHLTLRQSGHQEALIYMQITRGSAPRSHAFPENSKPLEFLYVQPYRDYPASMREEGARALLQPDIRWGRCDIKSTNLLGNVLAMQAAKEAGCVEAILYLPDGTLTEASHSSLFGVDEKGRLWTTPNNPDILPGITRLLVLRLADKLKIPVHEHSLNRSQLSAIPELFITGTGAEVMPIVQVDQQKIGTGKPGPVTIRLRLAYQEAVQEFLAGQP